MLSAAGCARAGSGEVIEGRATVVDGDGVEIDGQKIRLFGIDAPEIGQYCKRPDGSRWRCGQYATVELDRMAGGRTVRCEVKDRDRYERPVAVCRVAGDDVAEGLVAGGWAVAYRRFSDAYVDEEAQAKSAGVGIWRGSFELPWKWRERTRER